jgi:hypothetical protein
MVSIFKLIICHTCSCCTSVFPIVRSADHFWSARVFIVVRDQEKTYCYAKSLQISVLKSTILGHFIYETVRNPKNLKLCSAKIFLSTFWSAKFFYSVSWSASSKSLGNTAVHVHHFLF